LVVALLALAVFWGVALVTKSALDWPFAAGAHLKNIRNYSGPLGSLLAWLSCAGLGSYFAYFLPIAVIMAAAACVLDKVRVLIHELLKISVIVILLNAFFAITPYTRESTGLSGWIGSICSSALESVLGEIGTTIFLIALLLILLLNRAGFLTRALVDAVKKFGGIRKAFLFSLSLIVKLLSGVYSGFVSVLSIIKRPDSGLDSFENTTGDLMNQDAAKQIARKEIPIIAKGVGKKTNSGCPDSGNSSEIGSEKRKSSVKNQVESAVVEDKIPIEEASLPEIGLLEEFVDRGVSFPREELRSWAGILENKLANYNIAGKVTAINHGPLITTFEFEPAPGVKIKDIVSRADDISLAMKARSLRLIAPIPGRSVVGIEIPNPKGATVYLRMILEEIPEKLRLSGIAVGLGVDVMGKPFFMNLCDAPHLLIAGTTGSGKSVSLHGIISSILMHYRPSDVRLLIIDPKMVEMNMYNGIPHLLHPVTNDPRETVRVFQFLINEMEQRKELFKEHGVKNIESFNSKASMTGSGEETAGRLPYIVLIVDELGDLVLSKGTDLETLLSKLSNMARAVGIHMVVATQRPSVDVIVGKTKANFPTRIAFRVASKVDSRTILDCVGAERLLGRGDMLYMDTKHSDVLRLHGALISEAEVEKIVTHWQGYRFEPSYLKAAEEKQGSGYDDDFDPLYNQSKNIVLHYRQGSTSLLQRKLHVGYARAARLLDHLEEDGIVGPPDGSKPREVLVPEDGYPDQ